MVKEGIIAEIEVRADIVGGQQRGEKSLSPDDRREHKEIL